MRRIALVILFVLGGVISAFACSSFSTEGEQGTIDASADAGARDALSPDADAPDAAASPVDAHSAIACGNSTCSAADAAANTCCYNQNDLPPQAYSCVGAAMPCAICRRLARGGFEVWLVHDARDAMTVTCPRS